MVADIQMQSPMMKKRLHESTTALYEVTGELSNAKKMKRSLSVPHNQVALIENTSPTSDSDAVVQALILLKGSIEKKDSAMEQWFQRCDQQNGIALNRSCSSVDSSTSLTSTSSNSPDQNTDEGSHPAQTMINIQQVLRAKSMSKPSNPDEFLRCLLTLKGLTNLKYQSAASLKKVGYFPSVTEEFVQGYSMDIVTAVRNDDVQALRRIQAAHPTRSIMCGSKFGDSILHLACRRNRVKVVEYLLCECNVSPQIICDYGRTPLHDALWCVQPNERIVSLLLLKCPHLLFVKDHRGSTPLSYAPRDTWKQLCRFLAQHIKQHGTFLKEIEISNDIPHVVPADDSHIIATGQPFVIVGQ